MSVIVKLVTVMFLITATCKGQGWYCIQTCLELPDEQVPGSVGPGETVLTLPDFPDCPLLVTFRMWFCLIGNDPVYKVHISGWAPVDINDPGCAGLKASMYPSGYPGQVNQAFVLKAFNDLGPVVSKFIFESKADYQLRYPCPTSYETYEFVQGSCVKLIQSTYSSTTPGMSIDPFFKIAWCTFLCCNTLVTNCYNVTTHQTQVTVISSSSPFVLCDNLDVIAPPQGIILSTTCVPMCPEE